MRTRLTSLDSQVQIIATECLSLEREQDLVINTEKMDSPELVRDLINNSKEINSPKLEQDLVANIEELISQS